MPSVAKRENPMSDNLETWRIEGAVTSHPAFVLSGPTEEIGRISFDRNGVATFTGDVDASAQLFFDTVLKKHNRYLTHLEAANSGLRMLLGIDRREGVSELIARLQELQKDEGASNA
jgi:hypothetical protein